MRIIAASVILYLTFLSLRVMGSNNKGEQGDVNSKYKILALTPMGSRSHKNFLMGIVKALASAGHEITVVSTFKESKDVPNVRDVVIAGPDITQDMANPFKVSQAKFITDIFWNSPKKCAANLGSKEVLGLKKESFDFVLISYMVTECFMCLVHHFGVPYSYVAMMPLSNGMHHLAGSIYFDSLTPNILLNARFPATFLQRLQSTIATNLFNAMLFFVTLPRMFRFSKEASLCSPDMPHFWTYSGNNSLVIMNSVRALERPAQPWMPHIVHAGGIHCRPAKPLPNDLENWIEDSGEEGFIFFSLGSAVSPSAMPEEYRKILMDTFASLKWKVLWKWDQDDMKDLPPNVKISKWLPQQDVLGHPKIRLFITHGGLLSLQEATYHSCPVLGLPLFADQFNNVRQTEIEGWGGSIKWSELSEELLRSKIFSIIGSVEVQKVLHRRSNLMKDRLNDPADEVIYWVEYAIRHNGAEHLKSPMRELWWQW